METNDASQKKGMQLVVKGPVNRFATIKPRRVRLVGIVGETVSSQVDIVPEKNYPFKILEAKALKDEKIKVDVKEVEKEGSSEYKITIANTQEKKGRYFDTIVIKTDSEVRPELRISVFCNILEKKVPKS